MRESDSHLTHLYLFQQLKCASFSWIKNCEKTKNLRNRFQNFAANFLKKIIFDHNMKIFFFHCDLCSRKWLRLDSTITYTGSTSLRAPLYRRRHRCYTYHPHGNGYLYYATCVINMQYSVEASVGSRVQRILKYIGMYLYEISTVIKICT